VGALLNGSDIQTAGSLAELTGEGPPNMLPLYLIALACFVLFLIVEYRISTKATGMFDWASGTFPLIDPSLFRRQNFSPSVMVNFLVGAVLIIAMINVPLLVNVLETDVAQAALTSGWLLSAMTASMAVMAYVGGRLTERFSYRPVTIAGLLAIVFGFSLMGISWQVDTASRQMIWQLVVLGTGFGLVIAPIGAAVINAAPEDQRGIASGLVIVFRLIGMSVGLSGLTAWGLHRFEDLRQSIDLPPITDPDFQAILIDGLTGITVDVLTETFLISALVAAVAVLTALPLQPDLEISHVAELGQDLPE
jgi:MFS family permease